MTETSLTTTKGPGVPNERFNRKTPLFPHAAISMELVHEIDRYDSLTTMGIFVSPEGQEYFRYWTGESLEEKWVAFAYVAITKEQSQQIMDGKIDIRELLLTSPSDVFTSQLVVEGNHLNVKREFVHIERGRILNPDEVPRSSCFVGEDVGLF